MAALPECDNAPGGLGAALSGARAAAGLTQAELADRSGLSVRAIRNLETGRTGRPRRESIGLLAEALGLMPGQLATAPDTPWLGGAAAGPPAAPVRSELPAGPDPVGRPGLAVGLCEALTCSLGRPGPGSQRLAVVTGPPGSGKTATVIHVARLLDDDFPDRQSYIDLDGEPGRPMAAPAVAARVLRSFGFERLSRSPEEAMARARAALAAHRAIIVLDNVVSEAQVRPLLCAAPRSAILVAARRTLPALPAGHEARLGALTPDAAAIMLARIAGSARIAAESAAAASVTRACGYVPLAVQIAGLWVVARPHRRLGDLAERLADERDRLDVLRIGDLSLRASVAAAYQTLTGVQRAAIGRLCGLDGFFEVSDVAPLLAMPRRAAADLIDSLAQCQVIYRGQPGGGSGPDEGSGLRYRMHETFRLYAAQRHHGTRLRAGTLDRRLRGTARSSW
jgi:Helix-turn-helix domain